MNEEMSSFLKEAAAGSEKEKPMRVSADELKSISELGLAYIGDGVYEMMVRLYLVKQGGLKAGALHKASMDFVRAPRQAALMQILLPVLTEEEREVYRRGRNTKVNSVPKHASVGEYHAATGMETLWGWLYLMGRDDRLSELFQLITEDASHAS